MNKDIKRRHITNTSKMGNACFDEASELVSSAKEAWEITVPIGRGYFRDAFYFKTNKRADEFFDNKEWEKLNA
jgi:hypothetical protein